MTGRIAWSGVLLALLLSIGGAKAGSAAEESPAEASGLEARLRLEREDGRPLGSLRPGETLRLVLTLRNAADSVRRLSLPTAQTHDFAIASDGGRELWRWSAGRRFAQVLGELELRPGEERRFLATWHCAPGSPPGRYRAEASLTARGAGIRVEPVEFRIR